MSRKHSLISIIDGQVKCFLWLGNLFLYWCVCACVCACIYFSNEIKFVFSIFLLPSTSYSWDWSKISVCGWLLYKLIYSNTKLKINIQETKRSRNRTDSTTEKNWFEWATTRQKKTKPHQQYKQKNEINPLVHTTVLGRSSIEHIARLDNRWFSLVLAQQIDGFCVILYSRATYWRKRRQSLRLVLIC